MIIGADDITLDCGRHRIKGDESWKKADPKAKGNFKPLRPPTYGIDLAGHNGVIIQNCAVSGFRVGIRLHRADENELRNNTVTENDWAISMHTSSGNELVSNTATDNGRGIVLVRNASRNTITDNSASENDWGGIELHRGSNANVVTGNTAMANDRGIYVDACRDNELSGNVLVDNRRYGLVLESGRQNSITSNELARNGWFGAYLCRKARQNRILENALVHNGRADAREAEGCEGNSWSGSDGRPGNLWSDFSEKNPGFPESYHVGGPGDGVDRAPVRAEDAPQAQVPGHRVASGRASTPKERR